MACIESVTSCITKGDDWFLDITFTEDGVIDETTQDPVNPKNLTGASIALSLKDSATGTQVIAPTVVITSEENGRVRVSLNSAQTSSIAILEGDSRVLKGEVRITFSDGTKETMFALEVTFHESFN